MEFKKNMSKEELIADFIKAGWENLRIGWIEFFIALLFHSKILYIFALLFVIFALFEGICALIVKAMK